MILEEGAKTGSIAYILGEFKFVAKGTFIPKPGSYIDSLQFYTRSFLF